MFRHRHVLLKMVLGLFVIILASCAPTTQSKIRIKVAGAVIRMEPAVNGEIVQDKLAVGTVFTPMRKTGRWYDWYEVKYRSAIGVLLTGFIHESAVEKILAEAEAKPLPPPPVKK